jgi:hypothetical protein
MTITLNTKEFDEAILLWLKEQGFSTDRFSISTKLTVGRGDLGAGTRMEVTLDPREPAHVFKAMGITDILPVPEVYSKEYQIKTGPSFSKGHADE